MDDIAPAGAAAGSPTKSLKKMRFPPSADADAVEAKYRGRTYYRGKISRDCGQGKYDITYDDGDQEEGVAEEFIRPRRSRAA